MLFCDRKCNKSRFFWSYENKFPETLLELSEKRALRGQTFYDSFFDELFRIFSSLDYTPLYFAKKIN